MVIKNESSITEPTQITAQPATKHSSMRSVWIAFGIAALVLTTSGITAAITAYLMRADREQAVSQQSLPTSDGVSVVERVSGSVVSISTESIGVDFFGREYRAEGAGSGFIVTEDGYIVTNNHVIAGAQTVSVITSDDQKFEARVVATEAESDLALLKADTDIDLVPVTIGDSDDVRVGEEVYAIGNALGRYQNSVTKGIISGLGRPITASSSGLRGNLQEFEDLIQTDASINSGNSGGPLVNARGQVIGINTAVAGQAENIGFSVPIERAQALIERAQE